MGMGGMNTAGAAGGRPRRGGPARR
jgi:hypothetical protein